jgi:hypothetical protein
MALPPIVALWNYKILIMNHQEMIIGAAWAISRTAG